MNLNLERALFILGTVFYSRKVSNEGISALQNLKRKSVVAKTSSCYNRGTYRQILISAKAFV